MDKVSKRLLIEGVVQGVGFRPYIYRLAKRYNIKGEVRNTKSGVEICATGCAEDIEKFLTEISLNPPILAIIKKVVSEALKSHTCYDDFVISPSSSGEERSIYLSPDAAICDDCRREFFDKKSRYFRYPFVNCTNCGPRYSIITAYPYDRINTTMSSFEMCDDCVKEYRDIHSRRYHAEPVSCPGCGPVYRMLDSCLNEVLVDDVFETARYLMKAGKVLAVKGVGGYHLVCDGGSNEAVHNLRKRKLRDTKPFAVMFKDEETLRKYCYCSDKEMKLLRGKESPIILLRQKGTLKDENIGLIAGSSPYIGAMLPYAPYQYLLLEDFDMVVFTSGNLSGEPIIYRDDELTRLRTVADYFIVHNREIVRFVEDSVAKIIDMGEHSLTILIRKSRGFAPLPLFLNKRSERQIVGFGGDLKAAISFVRDDELIQSQYLGDLSDYQAFEDYKKTIKDFKSFFSVKPDVYVCDLHPAYFSSQYAEELAEREGIKLVKVQHHKAHVASVALEKGWFDQTFVGVAFDGTGFGEDENIWGGEFFVGSLKAGLERVAHLKYVPFPFGDAAIKEPEKSAFSYFYTLGLDESEMLAVFGKEGVARFKTVHNFIKEAGLFTSSMGRLFDAVSFLLGFRRKVGYEGEAAIELENLIYKCFSLKEEMAGYNYRIVKDEKQFLIDTSFLLREVVNDWLLNTDNSLISVKFHSAIINATFDIVSQISKERGIVKVALSGGSFQNSYLLYHLLNRLNRAGFECATNSYSPPNDASVSVGQCGIGLFLD